MTSDTVEKLFTLQDLSASDIDYIVRKSFTLKHNTISDDIPQYAMNRLMVLYMEKRSTRTRLSCTRAWTKMGGTVIDMSPGDGGSHIGKGESIYDSFRVIANMCDCIVARVYRHETLEEISRAVTDSKRKPIIINGLSDKYHPLQILADVLTMYEDTRHDLQRDPRDKNDKPLVAEIMKGKVVTWIGDANNVFNSLVTTLPRLNMKMQVAIPEEYPIKDYIWDDLLKLQAKGEVQDDDIYLFDTPKYALEQTKYIITDTWVSMGDEEEKDARLRHFAGYQVNNDLIESSDIQPDWKFLHCLPRKKEEVTDDIFYSNKSLVFQEAENRMWTTMAVLIYKMT